MLNLHNIARSFAGVQALTGVSLQFSAGEVHALCGENGAGKSTLMNIISGNLRPDTGDIYWHDQRIVIESVPQAQSMGIAIVHQERTLVDSLTVAENIFVRPPVNALGLIAYPALYEQTRAFLNELKLSNLSPRTLVGRLSAAQKQMVEIAKALSQQPSLLILDEPTASLSHEESAVLFAIIRKLQQKGVAVIYISHRMAEIKTIATRISVLKDGAVQGTFNPNDITTEQIISKMVGRQLLQWQCESNRGPQICLEAKNLSGRGFRNVSFTLHRGEILGIAGLQGSGRTALALALFGDRRSTSGSIFKNGEPVQPGHPKTAVRYGLAYIPEERKSEGLFMERSVSDNIVSASLHAGRWNKKKNESDSERMRQKLAIRSVSVRQPVQYLSGGNQQKVVLAKWLHTGADVFLVNEPTHGVDAGAKQEIYQELKKLTAAGKSIFLISSELPELLLLSDRIAVMHNGTIQHIISKTEASEERIMQLASGL